MTIISLQQDFLPTDTVVTPPGILDHLPEMSDFTMLGAYILVAGLGTFVVSFSGMFVDAPFVKSMIAGVLILGVGAVVFANGYSSYEKESDEYYEVKQAYDKQVEEQFEKNSANIFANIEAVYDVEKIVIEPDVMESIAAGKESKDKLPSDSAVEALIFQDGKAYDALLSQDPDTYEPLLSVHTSTHSDAPVIRKK